MVVMIPVLIGGMHFAVNTVHKAQETLSIDYNDISVSDDTDGKPAMCEYAGMIKCERIGLYSEVYYGVNRVSLRNGCGMNTSGDLKKLFGYSTNAFKPLGKIEVGDIVLLATPSGETKYKVTNIYDKDMSDSMDDGLVLCTTSSSTPFSIYNSTRVFVVSEEVQ